MSASSSQQNGVNPPCALVAVESGLLSGINRSNNTRSFLGVPYAAPPVGDLRWRPPQRPLSWSGVRPADKFGPSSLQFTIPPTSIYSSGDNAGFSEDCLYLNIYTGPGGSNNAANNNNNKNRPVLVWIHLGAFLFGSASNPIYNGERLAAEGITVVTVNHRLGRFGFLAHPELTAESGSHASSGNYGIMDQIAALEWVQRNIQAFGGDPNNVTVGGASAGGASVHILRASPLAKHLFAKAICESGPGVAPAIEDGLGGHLAAYTTLAIAEKAGAELLECLGASSIAELRKTPADSIVSAHLHRTEGPWASRTRPGSTSLSVFDTANPIIDGYVLPESPLTALLSGKAADVPLLAGNSVNEDTGMPHLASLADYHQFTDEAFGDHAEEARRLYPAATDEDVSGSTRDLIADQVFVWPTWAAARLQGQNFKSSVWYYRFAQSPPISAGSDMVEKDFAGAFHCAGVPYAFGNLDAWGWADWTDADKELSKSMVNAWTRFLRTGSPSDDDADASWPALTAASGLIKVWDAEPRLDTLEPRFCEMTKFWDSFYGVAEDVAT